MDFALSEEQEMLREQARSFLASEFPPERVVELAESDEGSGRRVVVRRWPSSGGRACRSPEEQGGAGCGFLEEAVLFEELGYGLYPGPVLLDRSRWRCRR